MRRQQAQRGPIRPLPIATAAKRAVQLRQAHSKEMSKHHQVSCCCCNDPLGIVSDARTCTPGAAQLKCNHVLKVGMPWSAQVAFRKVFCSSTKHLCAVMTAFA